MFNGLMKSEMKKAISLANRFYGRTDCYVSGYFAQRYNESFLIEWYEVECEICFGDGERADIDVVVMACMDDRRRSYASIR